MKFSIFLTIGLILVSSHIGEGQLAPSPAPTPAPAPAPGPGPGPGPALDLISEASSSTFGLMVGYYKGKCENKVVDIEAIIMAKVQQFFAADPTLLPALLRLQFHDCFVNGCDASILISGASTEQAAPPNLSVRGYDIIEAIKTAVEAECPGVVSCADITALATAFILQLGGGPTYAVETGRRDGLTSDVAAVVLPDPRMTVADSTAFFAARNFTQEEMVYLLGCHTIGVTHCTVIQGQNPLMDAALRTVLDARCPANLNATEDPTVNLNQTPGHKNTVDNTIYNQIILNRSVFSLDAALGTDPGTSALVLKLSLDNDFFKTELAKAMIKLQGFQVLTGDQGDIRNVCSKFN